MSDREAFVKWFESRYIDDIHPDSTIGIVAWETWQARVPEGYVVVPKEPTCEMVGEGFKEMCVVDMRDFSDESAVNIYKAMLEAVEK